jgi:hypothetical protein
LALPKGLADLDPDRVSGNPDDNSSGLRSILSDLIQLGRDLLLAVTLTGQQGEQKD